MYNYTIQFNNPKFYIADNTLLGFLKQLANRDSSIKQTFPIGKLHDNIVCRRLLYFKGTLSPTTIKELLNRFIQNYDFLTAEITQLKKIKPLIEGIDNPEIKYGCLMVSMDLPRWEEILKMIKPEDLYTEEEGYGLEKEPHATILYGLHKEVTAQDVFKLITKPVSITIKKISIFENANKPYDVVKFELESQDLQVLNSRTKKFPFTNDYPEYNPHCTIAYVKKGTGKNYIKELSNEGISIICRKFMFSDVDKKKDFKVVDMPNFLSESYSPEEIRQVLWRTFKEKIRAVDYEGIDKNGEMSFTVVPEYEFTLDDANHTMGSLNDTGMFDAWFEGDGSIKVKYYEN